MENVSTLDIIVDENDIVKGAKKILQVIRPYWKQDLIKVKLLTDGITNKLVRCTPEGGKEEDTVLVRIYGNKTDLLIDRKAETRNIILLSEAGLAPNLYATFSNGLAYQFVPGCTLTDESAHDPKVYKLVAKKMAQLHRVIPKEPLQPCLWTKLSQFFTLVPEIFSDEKKQKRYEEIIMPRDKIQAEIDSLKQLLSNLNSPIVFAHNDLLLGNVIYTEPSCVTFIDYEYAAPNYQAFDIGNHFTEYAGFDLDYSKYPDKKLQCDWLKTYLTEFHAREATDREIELLYVQVNQFTLASHLFWGIWALLQAEHSYIDFDFMGYAALRFNQYLLSKSELLSMRCY